MKFINSIANIARFLTGEKRYDCDYEGNAAKLFLGIKGRYGDESCTRWRYKVMGGKVRRNKSGWMTPLTNKAVIMYYQTGGPGSWYPKGEIGTKYKIILHRNFSGEKKLIRLP